MCRRVICLLCASLLLVGLLGGRPVGAVPMVLSSHRGIYASRQRQAPLVSAMFLVLAGYGISMLFDKRDRDR